MRKAFLLTFALTSSAALAAPCTTQVPASTPRISLQRTPLGMFRLHYEDSLYAYGPRFHAPTVSISGNTIPISQTVDDFGLPPDPQSTPPTVFCDGEDVELPALNAGIYSVGIVYFVVPPDPPQQIPGRSGGWAGFIIDGNLGVPCTTTRTFSTSPPTPVAGAKVTLMSTTMIAGYHISTGVVRNGNSLVVTDYKSTEVPTKYVPYCLSSSVVIDPLLAGTYSVEWNINEFGIPYPQSTSSFSFQVAAWTRHRAVR